MMSAMFRAAETYAIRSGATFASGISPVQCPPKLPWQFLGEPKERNPKLLPIGDGFGFLVIFEENTFFGDLS